MAVSSEFITIPGLAAAADLSASQYKTVKFASTAGQVKVVSAVADIAIGVLQNDPDAQGQPAEVACLGLCKALVEASVSAGNILGWGVTGRLKATTTDNTGTLGVAMEGATTTAGDIIRVQLTGFGRY